MQKYDKIASSYYEPLICIRINIRLLKERWSEAFLEVNEAYFSNSCNSISLQNATNKNKFYKKERINKKSNIFEDKL